MDDSRPIFIQIAERIEDSIIEGELAEETQVPSTNEYAAFYRINPATAGKGVNLLVDEGVLFKKRGIGMFVAKGAKTLLLNKRKKQFTVEFIQPLLAEANRLGISAAQVAETIMKEGTK
ncbi:MAG: GntR family transcriptional regulator [Cryobacterium sp.]|nr:GntR family transcriptional regulator [Cryobacterium sp.]